MRKRSSLARDTHAASKSHSNGRADSNAFIVDLLHEVVSRWLDSSSPRTTRLRKFGENFSFLDPLPQYFPHV